MHLGYILLSLVPTAAVLPSDWSELPDVETCYNNINPYSISCLLPPSPTFTAELDEYAVDHDTGWEI